MQTILSVFGTRPEAIKMAPVVRALMDDSAFRSVVCVTGQHREMLDQMLAFFDVPTDYDLALMQPGQTLANLTARTIQQLTPVLEQVKPDWVLVQGDTTTAMASALAAFYQRIPVAHVEAGLRTHNLSSPYPEEMNRQVIGRIATRHFAPTSVSAQHLLNEGVKESQVHVSGNTVIDALLTVVSRFQTDPSLAQQMRDQLHGIDWNRRIVLVTGHRRENWDGGLARMCQALKAIAEQHPDVQVVYPVHLNPRVQQPVNEILRDCDRVTLIEPQSYLPFVYLLSQCHLVITDSGGVQEEAPSLGKPILVTRDTTERPEGIDAGSARLVGTQTDCIVQAANQLLSDEAAYQEMAKAANPYGDGLAATKIVGTLKAVASVKQEAEQAVLPV
jgi:UDP-N-acetylglucosamine 2-epimerase (non-hydrolysing)